MSIYTEAIGALEKAGRPLDMDELAGATGRTKRQLASRLYELKQQGRVMTDEDHKGIFWLPSQAEGVISTPIPTNGHAPSPAPADDPISGDEQEFARLLTDCDVRRARDTITRTFFSGDAYDLDNLVAVLEDSRAYVNPNQAKLILRYWARYTGMALNPLLEERLGAHHTDSKGNATVSPDQKFVQDLGWKIEKDKDGEWGPYPVGELSYGDALKWAATYNASHPKHQDDAEDEADAPKGRGRRGAGKEEPSVLEMVKTLKELMLPEKDSSRDEEVRLLREQLEKVERDRHDDRMERLEGMIAASVNRNPIADYLAMRDQIQAVNPTSPVTDNSPTVQLVKDQTDKMDKIGNRLMGVLERAALQSGYTGDSEPEKVSTPAEREDRAGALAKKMEQGDKSKELRAELFGR